jgi:hypothetical protein
MKKKIIYFILFLLLLFVVLAAGGVFQFRGRLKAARPFLTKSLEIALGQTPEQRIRDYLTAVKKGDEGKALSTWQLPGDYKKDMASSLEARRQETTEKLLAAKVKNFKILDIEWWGTCCDADITRESQNAGGARIKVNIETGKGEEELYVFDVFDKKTIYWGEANGYPLRWWVLRDVYPQGEKPIFWTKRPVGILIDGGFTFIDPPLGYRLELPKTWAGKYEIKKSDDEVQLFYADKNNLKHLLFKIAVFDKRDWEILEKEPYYHGEKIPAKIAGALYASGKTIEDVSGLVVALVRSLDNPYAGEEGEEYQRMAGEINDIISETFWLGDYSDEGLKSVNGKITDISLSAKVISLKTKTGKDFSLALVSNTKIFDENNKPIQLKSLKRGEDVSASGELTSKKSLIPSVIRIFSPSGDSILEISDREACEAKNGEWGRVGLRLTEVCNLPTADAGKICSDQSDCEGDCLAELSEVDYEKLTKNTGKEVIVTKGKCTAWKVTMGCNAYVKNGRVEGIMCAD